MTAAQLDLWITRVGPADRRRDGAQARRRARHVFVREVIAADLALAPDDVRIDRRCLHCGDPSHGKPRLAHCDEREYSFSWSSADDVVVLAIGRGAVVGVDLERVRPVPDGVVKLACDPAERSQLAGRSDHERAHAFTELWVRKEAVLKASGVGITGDSLQRALHPSQWCVRLFGAPEGFVAALASDAPTGPTDLEVRSFESRTPRGGIR